MKTMDILVKIREKHNLTQDEMAERLFITRQAISRWETGETVPNTETLKLISKEFDVSINTLLGSPQSLVCQCCGMPLRDEFMSKEIDGSFNEDYCKACYSEEEFTYKTLDELMLRLIPYMAKMLQKSEEEVKKMLNEQLPKLKFWKNNDLIHQI